MRGVVQLCRVLGDDHRFARTALCRLLVVSVLESLARGLLMGKSPPATLTQTPRTRRRKRGATVGFQCRTYPTETLSGVPIIEARPL